MDLNGGPSQNTKGNMCVSCSSEQLERIGLYRSFATNGKKMKIAALLLNHFPFVLRSIPLKSFKNFHEKFHDFPFRGPICRCLECGLGQIQNMPSEEKLESFYTSSYWSERPPSLDPLQYLQSDRARSQVEFIKTNCPEINISSILEIGAGAATPSLLLRKELESTTNVQITVVEPGSVWKEYYQNLSIEILGSYFPMPIARRFSHIHASHWLEHITDPQTAVSAMSENLEENGTVFIEVPFADNDYWKRSLVDTPHTLFFSVDSLNALFQSAGFKVLKSCRFGISMASWEAGKLPSSEDFRKEESEGFWIRALYQKSRMQD
jgi:hypothetical protein